MRCQTFQCPFRGEASNDPSRVCANHHFSGGHDSAEKFLFHYADDKAWDILLLDIEMGAMDGVTMAKRVRQDNEAVQIVFITGYSDYIAEGYEVAALHYLMKPVNKDRHSQRHCPIIILAAWTSHQQLILHLCY